MSANTAKLKKGSLKALFEKKNECVRLICEQIALLLKKINSVSNDGRLYVFFAKRNSIINDLIEHGQAFVHLEQGDDVGYDNFEHQSLFNDLLKLKDAWKGMVKITLTLPANGYNELNVHLSVVSAKED
ncbi:MAG: hypothetical protein V1928_01450 [Parcubacteria group bacterium]